MIKRKATDEGDERVKPRLACEACHRRKSKCDGGTPCTFCLTRQIECTPSPLANLDRPRKKRFSEAELLDKIKKYEAALIGYGADLEAIRSGGRNTDIVVQSTSGDENDEYNSVLTTLDGDEGETSRCHERGNRFYDRIFKDDHSAWLFAIEPTTLPDHPPPFDMMKLWQVYLENVHPINRFLHAPTFQRLLYSHGSAWNLASASHQAICFSIYLAAVVSLSSEECEAIFFTKRDTLIEAYKIATQIHIRRAGLWRSSELCVLQALIIFLSTIQNFADSRAIVCFTAAADRIARRMGLHCNAAPKGTTIVEREVRVRLWWEIILLDSKAVERSGLGTSVMAGKWKSRLPHAYSDSELECLSSQTFKQPSQTSLETILFMIRCEGASFLASLRNTRTFSTGKDGHMEKIAQFEQYLQDHYLCLCNDGNILHRLARYYTKLILGRMRMSALMSSENSKRSQEAAPAMELELLNQCTENMEAHNMMRSDADLKQFSWFMAQNLPIVGYIMMLRLLQRHTSGTVADRAWSTMGEYKRLGTRLLMDSMTLKAWDARQQASTNAIEDPPFIAEARNRSAPQELPYLSTESSPAESSLEDLDFMALLSEMLSGEANNDFHFLQ